MESNAGLSFGSMPRQRQERNFKKRYKHYRLKRRQ